MNIGQLMKSAVMDWLGNSYESLVIEDDSSLSFAWRSYLGLCLIGVQSRNLDDDIEDGYFTVRRRFLIGEVTSSFDLRWALKDSHRASDDFFGIVELVGKDVLTLTGTSRYLLSWGPDRIQKILFLEFYAAPFHTQDLKGISELSDETMRTIWSENGFRLLFP